MLRLGRGMARAAAPVRALQSRWKGGAQDEWLEEGDAGMSPEEREVRSKQEKLLRKHAEDLNAQYEAEYERTAKQMETHQHKSAASVAALEAKIAELTAMIQQMKAENR